MSAPDSLQVAVDRLASDLGRHVLVENRDLQPLWWSGEGDVDPARMRCIVHRVPLRPARAMIARMRLASRTGLVRTPEVPEADLLARWCVPLRHDQDLLGYLWVIDSDGSVSQDQRSRIVTWAEAATRWMAETAAGEEEQRRQRAALLNRLLDGPDAAAARELALLEGLGQAPTVAVQVPADRSGWRLPDGMSAHVNPLAGSTATSGDSLPLVDLSEAVRRAKVVQQVLRAGATLTEPHWGALGAWHLVAAAPESLSIADINPGARVLLNLPRPELAMTALWVLEHGWDVVCAAADLHIHRTTLYYRLERIEALTGVNLKAGHARDDLHMALRLAAYRDASE